MHVNVHQIPSQFYNNPDRRKCTYRERSPFSNTAFYGPGDTLEQEAYIHVDVDREPYIGRSTFIEVHILHQKE